MPLTAMLICQSTSSYLSSSPPFTPNCPKVRSAHIGHLGLDGAYQMINQIKIRKSIKTEVIGYWQIPYVRHKGTHLCVPNGVAVGQRGQDIQYHCSKFAFSYDCLAPPYGQLINVCIFFGRYCIILYHQFE